MFKIITNKRYDELEARTVDLARTIRELNEENQKLQEIREISMHNNTVLLRKNKEQKKLLGAIEKVATSNTYNNDKLVLNKIKELISDYQS